MTGLTPTHELTTSPPHTPAMLVSQLLIGIVRVLVGASARWIGCGPSRRQRVYFANHTSHADALAIWAALPPVLRACTHPVAARDYWGCGRLRRWLAQRGFNALLIDRHPTAHKPSPLAPLLDALAGGDSLILFPEGTRGVTDCPGVFKSGLHRLFEAAPDAEFVPVYLENLHRSFPRGTVVPLPLLCAVRFGAPLARVDGECRDAFLARARAAVIATAAVPPASMQESARRASPACACLPASSPDGPS